MYSDHSFDPLAHHATTCKKGGDVIRNNDILTESFGCAGISVQCEAGSGLSHDNNHTRPADILVPNWYASRPAEVGFKGGGGGGGCQQLHLLKV